MSTLSASASKFVGVSIRPRRACVQRTVVSKAIRAEVTDEEISTAPFLAVGSTAPFERFDPTGLLSKESKPTLVRYREAELTHGRVCMLASVGILVGEKFNPLFNGSITGPAINHFQQVPEYFWLPLVFAISLAEIYRAQLGWTNPVGASATEIMTLKADYTPGDLGYDPLGLKPTTEAGLLEMKNKELNNGRLAMIGTAGMVVQELITQQTVW